MHFNAVAIGGEKNPLERPYVIDVLQYAPDGSDEGSGQKN
jgi:hypothetical protein